jgi:signal transduction histidine kinase
MPDAIDELRTAVEALPPAPAALAGLLTKVQEEAYTVTDADIAAATAELGSEDAVFEQLVRAAADEGFRRLDRALEVLA